MPANASVAVPLSGDVIALPALAVIAVVLPGDVITLVAAAATRAAVDRMVEVAAVNWLDDGGWGGGITAPSFRSFFLACTMVERCCWWKWLAEMYGSHRQFLMNNWICIQ